MSIAVAGPMDWSLRRSGLKWYEYAWALLPIGLTAVGGAIGGMCGGAAAALNLVVMRGKGGAARKYGLTAGLSAISVAVYVLATRAFLAATGLGVTPERVDAELKKQPIFVAIAKAEPDSYAKLRDTALDALKHGKSPTEAAAAIRPYVGIIARKYIPIASDEAVIAFADVMTLEIEQIGAKSADACFDYLFPQAGAPAVNVIDYITPEVAQREAAAIDEAVESGVASPQRVPARDEIANAMGVVGRALVAKFGADDVATLSRPAALDHGKACAMVSALYKDALSLPQSDGVPLLRYLFAQNKSA